MKTRAFTLIELLVVVLIIGILVAIAVPQYQLAVDKAHFSKLQSLAKSIQSSYENVYLATGEYPDSFDKMDISFSSTYQKTKWGKFQCVNFEDNYCCFAPAVANSHSALINCGTKEAIYVCGINYSTKKSYCLFPQNDSRAERLCKSVSNGSTPYHCGSGTATPTGWKYDTYYCANIGSL